MLAALHIFLSCLFEPESTTEGVTMQSRRFFIVVPILLVPLGGHTQQPATVFVGDWQGDVPGIGDARLIITTVRQSGQVEGRMEFSLNSFVSTFGDKPDAGKKTNYGVVSGSSLRIESALGGRYDLRRDGDQLTGEYTRGTTYRVAVRFKKS
jgi:hypothetical protein